MKNKLIGILTVKNEGLLNPLVGVPLALILCLSLFSGQSNADGIAKIVPKEVPVVAPGVLSLIAGSIDGPGADDGIGLNAQFGLAQSPGVGVNPKGITSDVAGNLYVADSPNHTIRKITPKGVVTTIAGKAGNPGSADGLALDARFNFPTGIVIDAKGALYVTDSANYTVRKISSSGMVTTLAGTAGMLGWADGTGSVARFRRPIGITVNAQGDVYVTDAANYCVRKITPNGIVTTLAGRPGRSEYVDATGSKARFGYAKGVTVDANGILYVADGSNDAIRRITPDGVVTSLKLTPTADSTGSFSLTKISSPDGIAIDKNGNLYVSSMRVLNKIDKDGVVTVLGGQEDIAYQDRYRDGPGATASFNAAGNVTFDQAGNLYLTDDQFIRKITAQGDVMTIAGQSEKTGKTDGVGAAARFNNPIGLARDKQGNLYVADRENGLVRKIDANGVVSTIAGTTDDKEVEHRDGTALSAKFYAMAEVALNSKDDLFVADMDNHVIRKISKAGEVTTIAGTVGKKGDVDGIGTLAKFHRPARLVIDRAGNLYTNSNEKIRKIDTTGVVSTVAGCEDSFSRRMEGNKDGIGREVCFEMIRSMAIDKLDNLYVIDDNFIRKISPAGLVTTLGNYADVFLNADNNGYTAPPDRLVVDEQENVYFFVHHTIRKLTPSGMLTTVAGVAGLSGNKLGRLGLLDKVHSLVMLGPKTLALTSGNAILKLTLP
ncbi:hypothetical protein [Undibacterium sp. Ren11W]|uniref:NHL domain-containing protein n=1 Tax=Undibacterium sp. Ren11W TaxID=3413045 RepID=UPI003BF30E7B